MNKTTIKLNDNLKKEYKMKVSRMILTPQYLKTIRAFFTLTLGAIIMRDWKLKLIDGVYSVSAPCKQFTNKNTKFENEPIVEVHDPKITNKILELALFEYNFRKEVNNDDTSSC